VGKQHGEHRRGHPGDRFDDLSGARAPPAVAVDAGPVRVEAEDLPPVVLGEYALLFLDVLEVGELINAGEQPVEFVLDLADASFDLSDPRKLIGLEELDTPGRSAGDQALEKGWRPPGDRTGNPPQQPPRHQCSVSPAPS
jgi:hypothetical protein